MRLLASPLAGKSVQSPRHEQQLTVRRNFFVFEAIMVPFEITACNLILHFWTEAIPTGAVIAIIIVFYALINVTAVKWYGETEFWAALGKMLLIIGLIIYTFITMVGGNPLGDAYGFR